MKRIFTAFAALVFATFAAWADPSGNYDFSGTTLEGEAYKGTLQVLKSGDVYELIYTYEDGTTQEGSAVGDDSFLAYGYADEEETGVGMMVAKEGTPGTWEGIWTNLGASKMSTEMWVKK
jgi:hypothetical protein